MNSPAALASAAYQQRFMLASENLQNLLLAVLSSESHECFLI
jgi:hypothetical protein